MSVEVAQRALTALGSAYRGDWSEMDGRTLRSQLDQISEALNPDSTTTYETCCLLIGVCPVNHCWPEHCDAKTGTIDCAHMNPLAAGVVSSTQPEPEPEEVDTPPRCEIVLAYDDSIGGEGVIRCNWPLNEDGICPNPDRVGHRTIDRERAESVSSRAASETPQGRIIEGPSVATCWCCEARVYPAEAETVRRVWETRLDGFCHACAEARCDAFPDECPKLRRREPDLCPCGARPESPISHPHAPGCPNAAAGSGSAAARPERDSS